MKRRNFLRSLFAAVVMAPALCRMAEQPPKAVNAYDGYTFAVDPNPLRFSCDDITSMAMKESGRIRANICKSLARPSPYLKYLKLT